jgi:geranylgeranyl diphosphate synthase, type I
MMILSSLVCGGNLNDSLKPAAVVEMIHNYSLVMDDIIDRARVRRGKPTIRVHAGESIALLIAMHYREVIDEVIDECEQSADVRRIAVDTMKEIIDGERLDLLLEQAGRNDPYLQQHRFTRPSITLYLDMIGKKTAALFRASSEIGAITAGAPRRTISNLRAYGWNAGLAFQVMDDVLDIFGDRTGKQSAKDIIEHKLGNVAVLTAMRFLADSDRIELMRILRMERVSPRLAEKAREMIARTPSEKVSREIALGYLEKAKVQLRTLEDSESARELAELADEFAKRSY